MATAHSCNRFIADRPKRRTLHHVLRGGSDVRQPYLGGSENGHSYDDGASVELRFSIDARVIADRIDQSKNDPDSENDPTDRSDGFLSDPVTSKLPERRP